MLHFVELYRSGWGSSTGQTGRRTRCSR